MTGFYCMHRGWLENPVFAADPLCDRAAWVWLIDAAAYKATKVSDGAKWIRIKRGQLCYSIRFLAAAWRWEKTKVLRFLSRLEGAGMITRTRTSNAPPVIPPTAPDTAPPSAPDAAPSRAPDSAPSQTLITICNYEKFQSALKPLAPPTAPPNAPDAAPVAAPADAPPTAPPPPPEPHQIRTKEINNKSITPTGEPAGFAEFYMAFPRKKGRPSAAKAYAKAIKRGATPQELLAASQTYARECVGTESKFIKYPCGWLNDERYTTDPHEQPAKQARYVP